MYVVFHHKCFVESSPSSIKYKLGKSGIVLCKYDVL